MWKEIKIVNKTYYIKCDISENNNVTLILYDQNEIWSEKISLVDVRRKVKNLNRRYDFDEENIRKTFGGEGELETASLDSAEGNDKLLLKVKYRVKDCPFLYEWNLEKQTLEEFRTLFVMPMLKALLACKEQMEILTDTIRKKDAEILQYRKDGAILGRRTLATKLFAFEEFERKYEGPNKLLNDFSTLGQILVKEKSLSENSPQISDANKQEKQDMVTTTVNKAPPISPGQKKRLLKKEMLEKAIRPRKPVFEYENSQSQSSEEVDTEKNITENAKSSGENSENKTSSKTLEPSPVAKSRSRELKNLVSNLVIAENPENLITENKTRAKPSISSPDLKSKEIKSRFNDTVGSRDKVTEDKNKTPAKTVESSIHVPKSRELKNLVSDLVIAESPIRGKTTESKTKSTLAENSPHSKCKDLRRRVTDSVNSENSEMIRARRSLNKNEVEKNSMDNESPRKRRKSITDVEAKSSSKKVQQSKESIQNNSQPISKRRTSRCLNFAENRDKKDEKSETESEISIMETASRRKQSLPLSKQSEDDEESANDLKMDNKNNNENKSNKTNEKCATNTETRQSEGEENSNNKKNTRYNRETDSEDSDVIDITPRKKKKTHLSKQPTIEESLKLDNGKSQTSSAKQNIQSLDICDTDSDNDELIRTPRKSKNLSLTKRTPEKNKPPTTQLINSTKQSETSSKDVNDDCHVVEISTDSESNYPQTSSKRPNSATKNLLAKSPTFVIKTKITRSTPQVLTTPKPVDSSTASSQSESNKGDGESDDISSQLEMIRKELKLLEAQRLADLKARTCKT
uniref:Non-homologous end-joining factor 1 n=1 Tax=Musca domestica TaxID=7370 RepID=A0A1I8MFJ6_MUSDO